MDRRRIKAHRRGLHENLKISSQASTGSEDIFLSAPRTLQKASQRGSSTELLRKLSTASTLSEKFDEVNPASSDGGDSPVKKKPSQKTTADGFFKNTSSKRPPSSRDDNDSDDDANLSISDDGTNSPVRKKTSQRLKIPRKESSTNFLRKLDKPSTSSKSHYEKNESGSDVDNDVNSMHGVQKMNQRSTVGLPKSSQRESSSELVRKLGKPSISSKNQSDSDVENSPTEKRKAMHNSTGNSLFGRKNDSKKSPFRKSQVESNVEDDDDDTYIKKKKSQRPMIGLPKSSQRESSSQLLRKLGNPPISSTNESDSDVENSPTVKRRSQQRSTDNLSYKRKNATDFLKKLTSKEPQLDSDIEDKDDDIHVGKEPSQRTAVGLPKTSQRESSSQLLRKLGNPSTSKNHEENQLSSDLDDNPTKKNQAYRSIGDSAFERNNATNFSKKSPFKRPLEKPMNDNNDQENLPKSDERQNRRNKRKTPDGSPAKFSSEERSDHDSPAKLSKPLPSRKKSPLERATRQGDDNIQNKTILDEFFTKSGIKLSMENDEQYSIDKDPVTIIKKMKDLLSSGAFSKDRIIRILKDSLENENAFTKALNPTIIDNDQRLLGSSSSASVVRILLQVPILQTQVLDILLAKLSACVLVADSIEEVPWACLLLQQLRFLGVIIDAESLTVKLEELLECSPVWFQRELIIFLPDIVTDPHHQTVAEMLCTLMEKHSDLTHVILDCISNLSLGKEYFEEMRDKILRILEENNCNISNIPAMIRFCVHDCPDVETCQKVFQVIRGLEMQPFPGENQDEFYTSQMLTVSALKMSMMLTKIMSNAALSVVSKTSDNSPRSFDLVIMLLLSGKTSTKKKVEMILKKHVKCGYYRPSLLTAFYQDYKEVAKDLQSTALHEASSLLKTDDRILVDFSVEWFRAQMAVHAQLPHKQREIIEKIILLMGKNDQTAKNALGVLRKMTETSEEKSYLQTHCNHLKILIEKIDKFDLEEVGIMNDLLHALRTDSNASSDALQDDLFILLQKQLSSADSMIKCKGVVGAVMAMKHLAGKEQSCTIAYELFTKVEIGTKDCPRSQALFHDKIGHVISTHCKSLNPEFLKNITDKFEESFINNCITDKDSYRGDLVPKFGMNGPETEPQAYLVSFPETKYGAVVPVLFRLMKICYMQINENGSVDDINALLGCRILMPKDLLSPDPRTLDMIFNCVNWFRELISAFVTEKQELLRKQTVQRLDDLMKMQGDLVEVLSMAESRYQPPPCYFHKFPPPPFVRVEKKTGKKGRKKTAAAADKEATAEKSNVLDKTHATTSSLPEWESWELGSQLCSKNPFYFRRLDATIANLLETNLDEGLKTSHICFVIKELLSMFETEAIANQVFVRDLVKLLPKICGQLRNVVSDLQAEPEDGIHGEDKKQTIRLLLSLLGTIFSWKGFNCPTHNVMLRDGLRTLAGQIDQANLNLRSSRQLVGASYTYFETLAEIATQISMAHQLVNMCKTLMKHSDSFSRENKDRQSKMAYGFLCLEWRDDLHEGPLYKKAVTGLLENWMDYAPDPLACASEVLEWLHGEAEDLERPQDNLATLRTIRRSNFHYLFQKLFDGIMKGTKISFGASKTDAAKLGILEQVAENVRQLTVICKQMSMRNILLVYLRHMPALLKLFVALGMPVLETNLRYKHGEITTMLKKIQDGTRYLNIVSCYSTEKKDMALTKLIPAAKTIAEQLIYRVKGMLAANNVSTIFWMGNLVNKNLDGQEILSQVSNATDEPSIPDGTAQNDHSDASLSDMEESVILGDEDEDIIEHDSTNE